MLASRHVNYLHTHGAEVTCRIIRPAKVPKPEFNEESGDESAAG